MTIAGILLGLAPRLGADGTAFVIKNGGSIVLARNLDSPAGDGYVFVNKRGVAKEAFGRTGTARLRWTSRYGSVTFNQFGREFPMGGINEEGLSIEALSGPADYAAADERPSLNELQWLQHQLDSCRSVKDIVKTESRVRIAKLFLDLHFLAADRSGKTAVIEFVKGRLAAFTGGDLPVPVLSGAGYGDSVNFLNRHQGFGGDLAVPNGPGPKERFVRTAAWLQDLLWSVGGILSDHAFGVLRSAEQTDTRWNIVYNIPRGLVFFKTRAHRRLKMIRLEGFDFSCATPAMMLPVDTEADRVVNGAFEPYDPRKNRGLLETVFLKLSNMGTAPDSPSADLIRKMSDYPETCACLPK